MGITVLYPKDQDDIDLNLNLSLDIIAVHGLNGDSLHTWTDSKSKKLWLRDFLPGKLPHVRIMTFGYNATAAFENSTANIGDHARDLLRCAANVRESGDAINRPLIFVGHSLGGLVIKQALVTAELEPRYKKIYTSVSAVVFFGTPHQGSNLANYAATLARIPTLIANKPNPALLESLKKGSSQLKHLNDKFRRHLENRPYSIVSFYETRTMKSVKSLVVEKASALLTPPDEVATDENQIPVDATHRDMCRFSSAKNKTFITFVQIVQQIHTGFPTDESQNEYYVVPHTVNPLFTGRNDIRQRLSECLITDYRVRPRVQQRFVLYGLGGSGKTQMCLKFAQDHLERFWGVFWIDATSTATAEEGFRKIAQACKQEESISSITAWLSGKDNWLLIIDNADDPDLDISRFFPTGNRGKILITTRNPDCQQHGSAGSCRVDRMSSEDAITLLLRTAAVEDVEERTARDSAEKVVKVLGHLAIAIVQAGAVIRRRICSLDGFCELYSLQKKELLESGCSESSNDYQLSVYTTWEISVRKIEEMAGIGGRRSNTDLTCVGNPEERDDSDESSPLGDCSTSPASDSGGSFKKIKGLSDSKDDQRPNDQIKTSSKHAMLALELLRLFSFMHFDDIREDIFKYAVMNSKCHQINPIFGQGMLFQLMPSGWDPLFMGKALQLLVSFSLIKINESRSICMHPLVHEWSKDRMHEQERRQAWAWAATTISMSITCDLDSTSRKHQKYLLPHMDSCLASENGQFFADAPNMQQWYFTPTLFSRAYAENFRFEKALALASQDLKWKEKWVAPSHDFRHGTMELMAQCLFGLYRFTEAIDLRKQLLEEQSKRTNDNRIMLSTNQSIADTYLFIGEYQKSVDMCKDALQKYEGIFAEDDPITLITLSLLVDGLLRLGRPKEAVKIAEKVLEKRREILGDNNPATWASMGLLARAYRDLSLIRKAVLQQEETLRLTKKYLGENSPEAAFAETLLAWVCDNRIHPWLSIRGKVRHRREALATLQLSLGETDPRTLRCMSEVADDCFWFGSTHQALLLKEKVVKGMIETLGKDHWSTVCALQDLADIRRAYKFRKAALGLVPERLLNRLHLKI